MKTKTTKKTKLKISYNRSHNSIVIKQKGNSPILYVYDDEKNLLGVICGSDIMDIIDRNNK